jgi:hypothetical protein
MLYCARMVVNTNLTNYLIIFTVYKVDHLINEIGISIDYNVGHDCCHGGVSCFIRASVEVLLKTAPALGGRQY